VCHRACADATFRPCITGQWTELNTPCYEDGANCIVNAAYPEPGARAGTLRVAHGAVAMARAAATSAFV
jgi:hypothetical protein